MIRRVSTLRLGERFRSWSMFDRLHMEGEVQWRSAHVDGVAMLVDDLGQVMYLSHCNRALNCLLNGIQMTPTERLSSLTPTLFQNFESKNLTRKTRNARSVCSPPT
jgi:hypothetical protein